MTGEGEKMIIPGRVIPVSSIDLRDLSETYAETDVYLSIYLPTATRSDRDLNRAYLESRTRDIKKVLDKQLIGCFQDTLDWLDHLVDRKPLDDEKGIVIFASKCEGFAKMFRLSTEVERKMVLDTSPFLLPLAKLKDEYEDYGLLLMDSQEARLMIVRSSRVEESGKTSIDLMKHHKKGGMSQMRFNRLRRGAIHAFVMDVVEDLRAIDDLRELRGLVIAGPGSAKKQLIDQLPQDISDMVIGTIDADMDMTSGDLISLSDAVASDNERKEEQDLLKEFRGAVMRGDPAIYGVQDIRIALEEGRVEVLLILDGTSVPGWICERCQTLKGDAKKPKTCPSCGGPTSFVDMVEEMYEILKRMDGKVEFVKESTFLESIGGLGAILRY